MHEFTATEWGAFTASANPSSNRLVFGPVVSQPDLSVSTTSFISSSEIPGLKNGTSIINSFGPVLSGQRDYLAHAYGSF